MGDDGLLNIGLPDADHTDAVIRNPRRVNQTRVNGKGACCSRQVAAVAAPVHKRAVDRDLTVQVIDVVFGLAAFRQNHALGGRRGGATHAVDVRTVRIGAADHAHEQVVTRLARHLTALGQILQTEEHAFTGTATNVGGGNFDLGCMSHENVS